MGMEFPDNRPRGLMTPTAIVAVGVRPQPAARRVFYARRLEGARMNFSSFLVVTLGGALGSLARYLISALALPISRELPLGTLIINVLGSFIIGFFGTMTLANGKYPVSESLRLFVMVGLCGGFTTFSSFSLQTLDLMRGGYMGRALFYVVASVVLCVLGVGVGHALAARLNGGAFDIAQIVIEEEA
jgi:CrcB protein